MQRTVEQRERGALAGGAERVALGQRAAPLRRTRDDSACSALRTSAKVSDAVWRASSASTQAGNGSVMRGGRQVRSENGVKSVSRSK